MIACDRGATSDAATQDVSKATSDAPPPAVSPPAHDESVDAKRAAMAKHAAEAKLARVAAEQDAQRAVVEPAPTIADAPREETFDALIDRLADGVSSGDAAKDGFAQLEAGAYAKAQPFFALAAQRDRVAWKHPFNLACAAAKNGDDDIARVALVEAVRRGGEKTAAKARTDADLASVRDQAWFEPVLRGEPWPKPAAPAIATPVVPANPEPKPAPEDTGPKQTELPHGETTPIAAAQLDTIVAALAPIHHATPVVRASLQHGDTGWAIYEYSRYEACLGEQAAGIVKQKKDKCRSRKEWNGKDNTAECTDQWLVRTSSLAPLTIAARTELSVGCALHDVRRLDVLDLDADGQDEILVDVIGAKTSTGFRDSQSIKHSRKVRVLRLDGSEQLAFDVALTEVDMTPNEVIAKRFELGDDNGDGHPDMRVWMRRLMNDGMDLDDEMWPAGPASEELGEIRVAVWRYDEAKDVWKKK
ncbi:MAG TPA: hypothetical protein VG755_16745 [Nannocystaceae bacterium]|nr:hypothetical protein [Nannocystaceae bacterium]